MTSESKKPSNLHSDDLYTAEDANQFTKLIQSCDRNSTILISTDEEHHSSVTRAFRYSSNDDDVFKKLCDGLGKRQSRDEGNAINTRHYDKVETVDGYTSTDQENFSSLMSFSENNIGSTTSEKSAETDDRNFSYSDQDQLCFEQLMPRNEQEGTHSDITSNKEESLVGTNDRDVGVIKIIEYDKIKSNKVKKEDRPNENVKIRFFD